MMQRVEQPPEEAILQGTRQGHVAEPAIPVVMDGNGQSPDTSLWQSLLGRAGPAERAALLASVTPTGILYTQQLPSQSRPLPPQDLPSLVTDILAGRTDHLEPHVAPPADWVPFDPCLDEDQQEAIWNALHTPDLYLIQGLPGTGKTRVVTELVTQAAIKGLRVLLVAPAAAAIDGVLEQVAGREELLALRCLGTVENQQTLSPVIASLTLAGQTQRLLEQAQARAAQELERSAKDLSSAEEAAHVLARMDETARGWQKLEGRRLELTSQRQQQPAKVQDEAGRWAEPGAPADHWLKPLEEEHRRHQSALADLEARTKEAAHHCSAKHREWERWTVRVTRQARIVEAKQQRRWLSWTWWRALFQGRSLERLGEFQCRLQEADSAFLEAQTQSQEAQTQRNLEVQRNSTALEQIVAAELSRRLADLDRQLEEIDREQHNLQTQWQQGASALSFEEAASSAPSPEVLEPRRHDVLERTGQARRHAEFARQWSATVAGLAPALRDRLTRQASLVAGPLSACEHDPVLRDAAPDRRRFDLLIVEQADQVTEAEFRAVASRASSCVLVGQPASSPGESERVFFHRLWNALQCDLRKLPYGWTEEANRLVCQLLPLSVEDRKRLERESVVDQPEIELRILAPANGPPALAEVSFPAKQFPIQRAKAYVYQEMQELAFQPGAASLTWRQGSSQLILDLDTSPAAARSEISVPHEEGIREVVRPASATGNGAKPNQVRWTTVRLEFDLASGWDRRRAAKWLSEKSRLRDLARTATLRTCWRLHPELASVCCAVLEPGPLGARVHREPTQSPLSRESAVLQFNAVPGPGRTDGRSGKSTRSATKLDGRFEIDLSDPRQRQRLPLDLQMRLPPRGFVNLAEAEAIIQRLRQFQQGVESPEPGSQCRSATLAVLSWNQPQVLVLATLWEKSCPDQVAFSVTFATTAEFREREADVVLLSLCRHSEQPGVVYAEHASHWRHALMAARSHLLVFGDLGTLSRRSRNRDLGPSQGETAQEQAIAARLLKQIEEQERRPRPLLTPQEART